MIDSKIFNSPPLSILMWFGVFLMGVSILPILSKFPNWIFWFGLTIFAIGIIFRIFQDNEENEAKPMSAGDGRMPQSISEAMER